MTTPKFFITHSWKDIEFARRLFKDLTGHGVDGWMDDSTMRGGQRLAEEINRGLEGCKVYLPILSPAALESPWCWEEINAAIALTNRRGRDKKLRIIPIIAVTCEIPSLLGARFYFDFVGRYDDALAELLSKGFGVQPFFPGLIADNPQKEQPARPLLFKQKIINLFKQQPVASQPNMEIPKSSDVPMPTLTSGRFIPTYTMGNDNYDTSYSLETSKGEFLGECGMGISETIGEGKPDKVTAFDLWLFDKADVRTVTQIVMSDFAFKDQTLRTKLQTKGEAILAEKGKTLHLETQSLQIDAHIVELIYATNPSFPPSSHFQKLLVELAPTQKQAKTS